jgi:uncharacterized membrane protein YadS
MIIPICLGLAALTARRHRTALAGGADTGGADTGGGVSMTATVPGRRSGRVSPWRMVRLVPWFLIGFIVAAALNSAGAIPAGTHGPLQHASVFLVAVALSAIGLSTDVAALRKAGPRPLLLGALLWITVAAASLGLQLLTGTLS